MNLPPSACQGRLAQGRIAKKCERNHGGGVFSSLRKVKTVKIQYINCRCKIVAGRRSYVLVGQWVALSGRGAVWSGSNCQEDTCRLPQHRDDHTRPSLRLCFLAVHISTSTPSPNSPTRSFLLFYAVNTVGKPVTRLIENNKHDQC